MSDFNFEEAFERCDIDSRESCKPEEVKKEDEEENSSFYDLIKNKFIAPAFSGVNFSRLDIKKIAYEFGEKLPIDERKKMINQLLKFVDSEESLNKLFTILNRYIDERVVIYRELSQAYPASEQVFNEYIKKTENAKKLLENISKGEY